MNIRKNKFHIIICLIISLLLLCITTSCKVEDDIPAIKIVNDQFPTNFNGYIKDKNIYVTSIGQDAEMIKFQITTLEKQDLFDYTIDSFLNASDVLEGSIVFIFVGCSVKALGESGLTIQDEMSRANEFIERQNRGEISIIALHTGGADRRGSTSDQFITKMFSNSNLNIYVDKGNYDNMLSEISVDYNIPAYQIISSTSLADTIKLLYGE